mgnify:CR=1 FL=1
MRPFRLYTLVWVTLALVCYLALPLLYRIPAPWRVLISLNIAAFLLFLIDKVQSQTRGIRVPERLLHLASFLGGSVGALLAMHLFRHKTRKVGFQLILVFLILIQIAIILIWNGQTKIWF